MRQLRWHAWVVKKSDRGPTAFGGGRLVDSKQTIRIGLFRWRPFLYGGLVPLWDLEFVSHTHLGPDTVIRSYLY